MSGNSEQTLMSTVAQQKRPGAQAKERRENRSLDGRNVRELDDARPSKVL